jgi:hypothetical protein
MNRTEIPSERMADDKPPLAPEIFFFPSRIVGFNIRRKKWGKTSSIGFLFNATC